MGLVVSVRVGEGEGNGKLEGPEEEGQDWRNYGHGHRIRGKTNRPFMIGDLLLSLQYLCIDLVARLYAFLELSGKEEKAGSKRKTPALVSNGGILKAVWTYGSRQALTSNAASQYSIQASTRVLA